MDTLFIFPGRILSSSFEFESSHLKLHRFAVHVYSLCHAQILIKNRTVFGEKLLMILIWHAAVTLHIYRRKERRNNRKCIKEDEKYVCLKNCLCGRKIKTWIWVIRWLYNCYAWNTSYWSWTLKNDQTNSKDLNCGNKNDQMLFQITIETWEKY